MKHAIPPCLKTPVHRLSSTAIGEWEDDLKRKQNIDTNNKDSLCKLLTRLALEDCPNTADQPPE